MPLSGPTNSDLDSDSDPPFVPPQRDSPESPLILPPLNETSLLFRFSLMISDTVAGERGDREGERERAALKNRWAIFRDRRCRLHFAILPCDRIPARACSSSAKKANFLLTIPLSLNHRQTYLGIGFMCLPSVGRVTKFSTISDRAFSFVSGRRGDFESLSHTENEEKGALALCTRAGAHRTEMLSF